MTIKGVRITSKQVTVSTVALLMFASTLLWAGSKWAFGKWEAAESRIGANEHGLYEMAAATQKGAEIGEIRYGQLRDSINTLRDESRNNAEKLEKALSAFRADYRDDRIRDDEKWERRLERFGSWSLVPRGVAGGKSDGDR